MRENNKTECKASVSDSFLRTASACASYQTGQILFGVADDGRTIGLDNPEKSALKMEQSINDALEPVPTYELQLDAQLCTVTLTVHKGPDTPHLSRGKAYKRVDTSTRPADRLELSRLCIAGQHVHFDALPAADRQLTFKVLTRELKDAVGIEKLSADVMRSLGLLLPSGQYTNAAAILADSNDFPGIRWVRFGENVNDIRE
ncbi:MAG: hypothetical protein HDQ87_02035 [Clostridia bacterium]|nr:hypothetical protein [Clostridia bacterium]